jgi:putative DNA primase/helicase
MSQVEIRSVEQILEDAGLMLDRPLALDASIQRWKVAGEDHERRGWSRLERKCFADGVEFVAGSYGVWHGPDDGRQTLCVVGDKARQISSADIALQKAALAESKKRIAAQRKHEVDTAARWAAQVWAHCAPATEHEYLARKRIGAHGTRVFERTEGLQLNGIDDSNWWRLTQAPGALVVPMHDQHGNVVGVQFVYPAGHARKKKLERDKEFWPSGMALAGSFGLIGPLRREGVMLLTEGFATAASLFEATGYSVAYAFSANNLGKAGKLLRKTCPRARLLFCADDDYLTEGNPGCAAAAQASAEIDRSAWLAPDFSGPDGADLRGKKKLSDFNDLCMVREGPLALAQQVHGKLDALGWRDGVSGAGTGNPGGAGKAAADGDARPAARSVMSLDELVARFMPLDDGTGKYLFDQWTRKVVHRDQMAALFAPGVKGDDVKRHAVWQERGAYYLDEVGFDPSGGDDRVRLNTWRGWQVAPKPGSCERMLETIEYLCGGEDSGREVARWLLCWMAYPLQNPGAKMSSAVILHGPQGTGKSAVFQTLAKIYGDYSTVLNQRGLEDKFNADWADSKLFILAEEVVTRAEMWHIKNELKELVTGEWIRINPKNLAAYRQRNHVNIMYLSNEGQPLPLDNDDRRHLVVYTPPPLSDDFYDELWREVENGGAAALYDHLLGLDLSGFYPKKRPPMTGAKRALINLSMPSEMRFITEFVQGDTRWPVVPCLKADFYTAYLRWCRENGEQRPRPSNHFFGSLGRLPGWEVKKARLYQDMGFHGEALPRPVAIPPPEAVQRAGREKPPAEPMAQWLTQCTIEFAHAGSVQEGARWAA